MNRVPWYLMFAVAAWSGPGVADSEISLPDGFEATVFHDGLGKARHIVVRDNGDVYVARSATLEIKMFGQEAGYGGLVALRDTDDDDAELEPSVASDPPASSCACSRSTERSAALHRSARLRSSLCARR